LGFEILGFEILGFEILGFEILSVSEPHTESVEKSVKSVLQVSGKVSKRHRKVSEKPKPMEDQKKPVSVETPWKRD
jgi:hypothetical protein